ncbi:MAG TPA: class I SAM-dependent methyltransferase [Elainellaceae cyanobacterium]
MRNDAQTFWLESLRSASHYNQWIFSQIYPYLGDRILEVGCGNGNFTELLAHACSHLVAIDHNEHYVQTAIARLPPTSDVHVLTADVTQLRWHQPFDTIIMLDVLEHIADDVDLLHQLNQCLIHNGKLILKVPALNALYTPMDSAVGHHRRYSKSRLIQILQGASFPDLETWYFNVAGIPGWWFNGTVLGRTTPLQHHVSWFDRAVPLLRHVESKIPPPVGLSLFAVATKSAESFTR